MKRVFLCLIWSLLCLLESAAQQGEASFYEQEITDEIFARMRGKSFKEGCTTPRSDLRYLRVLHYDAEGAVHVGELVCHKRISRDLLEIFRRLYEVRYPIERMVLVDEYAADDEASMTANNTSAFNFRYVSGTQVLSKHSTGMAIDINPRYNPYVRRRGGRVKVSPTCAEEYVDRSRSFPYQIVKGDICYRLFKEHGFTWGGDWKNSKDYQHFEK